MKTKKILFIITIILFMINIKINANPNVEEGKKLYKSKCTSCHSLDKKLVGPPLRGVTQKYDLKWFTKWVISSTALIKSGDAKAVKIFNEYFKIPMTDNKDLKPNQVAFIYEYLKNPN